MLEQSKHWLTVPAAGLVGMAGGYGCSQWHATLPRAMDPEPVAWFRTQGSGYATGEVMVFCGVSGIKNVSLEKNWPDG